MSTRPMVFAPGAAQFIRMLNLLSLRGEELGRPSGGAGRAAVPRGGRSGSAGRLVGVRRARERAGGGNGRLARGAWSPGLKSRWPSGAAAATAPQGPELPDLESPLAVSVRSVCRCLTPEPAVSLCGISESAGNKSSRIFGVTVLSVRC